MVNERSVETILFSTTEIADRYFTRHIRVNNARNVLQTIEDLSCVKNEMR